MIRRHPGRAAAVLVVAFALAAAIATPPAAAQSPSAEHPHERMDGMRGIMGPHVAGHIAFLKAELAITEAQAPLWDKVAAAMREDVAQMEAAMAQAPPDAAAPTAVAYLERRARIAMVRAQGEARFLAAFRPLYDALSPDQRKSADELLTHGHP